MALTLTYVVKVMTLSDWEKVLTVGHYLLKTKEEIICHISVI